MGLIEASESCGLFGLRRSLWSSLLDLIDNRLVEKLKAGPLYTRQPLLQIKVISPNKLADLLDIEILEL